jgi:lysophospholipase L1-like esterase
MKRIVSLSAVLFLCLVTGSIAQTDTTRLVCVGNSITEGSGTTSPSLDAYPIQAGALLGKGWVVKNSGVSGRTMLRNGDFPIWREQRFKDGLAFNPDIVTICLGTNDSKPWNWDDHKEEYISDYSAMIDTFRALPSRPVVWIALPPPVFANTFTIRDSIITTDIIPWLRQLALDKDCPLIDFYTPLKDHAEWLPDGVHPNNQGAAAMARVLYETLTGDTISEAKDENVAKGKAVASNGSVDEARFGDGNLNDGDRSTLWIKAGFPAQAVVDLGSVNDLDLFQVDFAGYAGAGFQFAVETCETYGDWSTAVDMMARTDTSVVAMEKVDSLRARYVRLTVTGASAPRGDTSAVAELRAVRPNPGGAHAPVLAGRTVKVLSSATQIELNVVSPNGEDGAWMLFRKLSSEAEFKAVTGFRAGGSVTRLEYIKKGASARYYTVAFLNNVLIASDTVEVGPAATAVAEREAGPGPHGFALLPNFPNPFNPSTTLAFALPYRARAALRVYDVRGRLVRELVNGDFPVGMHRLSWDAKDGSGLAVPGGVYVARLESDGQKLARKILLVR